MKLDMHIHSRYSRDAKASPKEIAAECKRVGLDGFAIADHNVIQGSLDAVSVSAETGLLVVRAVEVSAEEGHVLAYGVRELVPKGLPVAETIDKIHAAGGLSVAAHPKRFPSGMGIEAARAGKFDAIEVLNGNNSGRSNGMARRVAEERKLPKTGGSDSHELESIGRAFTVIDGASTEDQVLDAILKNRATVGGRSRSMGEGARYSWEVFLAWARGDFRRL